LHKLLSKTLVNVNELEMYFTPIPDGGWTKNQEEMDIHFPGCCIERTVKDINTNTTQLARHRWIPSVNWKIASDIVTGKRIKWGVDCMCPFKSPGKDGILTALLQNCIVIPTTNTY